MLAYDRSKFVRQFIDDALIDCKNRITKQFDKEIQLLNFDRIYALKDLVTEREIKNNSHTISSSGGIERKNSTNRETCSGEN